MSTRAFHDRPVFPRGFRCASRNVGLKPTAKDLALFASEVDAAAAAVFTRNDFKALLRGLGARTLGALEAALTTLVDAITASDAAGFFRHCGYAVQ